MFFLEKKKILHIIRHVTSHTPDTEGHVTPTNYVFCTAGRRIRTMQHRTAASKGYSDYVLFGACLEGTHTSALLQDNLV